MIIQIILDLGEHLEDCEFDSFWRVYKENKKFLEQFKSFEFEIRRYICLMIQSVYQNISISFLCEILQFNTDKQLIEYLNMVNLGWDIDVKNEVIRMPKTDENSDEVQRKTQFVSTDSMNQILSTFSSF